VRKKVKTLLLISLAAILLCLCFSACGKNIDYLNISDGVVTIDLDQAFTGNNRKMKDGTFGLYLARVR
jgi:hypothetical protein